MLLNQVFKALHISYRYSLPERVSQWLVKLGVETDDIPSFLYPDRSNLHDPFLLPDMVCACERVKEAIEKHRHILIYGDFDADGITATALLYLSLSRLTDNITHFLPNRMREGYDLSSNAISNLIKGEDNILITVDCGIKAVQQIDEVRELFKDIIVIDHHKLGERLPDADAIVSPRLDNSRYPFKELAGVGLAYKFITALMRYYPEIKSDEYLDLVAIGTVADVVSLSGENRTLVKLGLDSLSTPKRRVGIEALLDTAGLKADEITSWHISFVIAPRLNASGRLSDATLSLKLLLSEDKDTALNLAQQIEKINRERKSICDRVYKSARDSLNDGDVGDFIVLSDEDWHPGVIGIVASRILDEFKRPTALISTGTSPPRGSARSIGGIDLTKALRSQRELLVRFGGHKYSAGFSIEEENISKFREGLNEYASHILDRDEIDDIGGGELRCSVSEIDKSLVEGLRLMEPFGESNPLPLIELPQTKTIGSPRIVGNNHIKFKISDGVKIMNAIEFNSLENLDNLSNDDSLNITGYPIVDTWQGVESITFKVHNIKKSDELRRLKIRWEKKKNLSDIDNSLIITNKPELVNIGQNNIVICRRDIYNEVFCEKDDDGSPSNHPELERIIYLSPPLSSQELGFVSELIIDNNGEVIFAFEIEEIEESLEGLERDYPDRSKLIEVYRNIGELGNYVDEHKRYNDFLDEIRGELSDRGIENALRIFVSLGLIVKRDSNYELVDVDSSANIELHTSPVYRLLSAMRDSREEFLRGLLSHC